MLTAFWRKLVLVLHVLSSVGFIGGVAGFLALAVVGATTLDPISMRSAYVSMAVLTWDVIVPLAAASLIIGIVQSLGTPWGLFRYYWIIVKFVLTVAACAVLALQTITIDDLATAALRGSMEGFAGPRLSMILHGAGGIALLVLATVLSIYKPRGVTRYGAKAVATSR